MLEPNAPPPPFMRRPQVTSLALLRLANAYVVAGEELIGRPWRLSAGAVRRGLATLQGGLLGTASAETVLASLGEEAFNLLFNLAIAVPDSISNIAAGLDASGPDPMSGYDLPISGADPVEHGMLLELGPERAPFVLPARILDASQGFAAWYIDCAQAAALLEPAMAAAFEPVDCGGGRTMALLLGTDSRVGDLGRHHAVQLALSLSPHGGVSDPGAFYFRTVVSGAYSIEPSRRAWGLQQDKFKDLNLVYRADSARFFTGHGGAGNFSIRFPRFGKLRSEDVALPVYALRAPDEVDMLDGPVRLILNRSGAGEGVQVGGSVALTLGDKASATCFCSAGIGCLCETLSALGLDRVQPAANGWTERMRGTLAAATPV
ncbi:MAG: hypothetical protein B7Z80_01105 [Rhodospirillales bacterium 20-64-7]|nr:MAG: hypothetical protein B7Z80_01105 [Rhodospirillales bacterium 20-64-7]